MATRELDRWLLNRGAYPEEKQETVHPANTSEPAYTSKSVILIVCRTCLKAAERIGAQDFCDVYKCGEGHITRYEVGKGLREPW